MPSEIRDFYPCERNLSLGLIEDEPVGGSVRFGKGIFEPLRIELELECLVIVLEYRGSTGLEPEARIAWCMVIGR